MRNKRALIVVAALVACLAIGSATVASAKQKTHNIKTTITLTVTATEPTPYTTGSATVSGKVKAKGPSGCKKGRTVTIVRNGATIATVVTGPNGEYTATISGDPSGTYQATAEKRVINKKKKQEKFICAAATTAPVVVP